MSMRLANAIAAEGEPPWQCGPAAFASGLFEGIARNRARAFAGERAKVQEALRLQKEAREGQDRISKEYLNSQKAKNEFEQATRELDLLEQRKAQIMASPGVPFRDSALEGALEKAKERMADAREGIQESQGKLQDLIADRDARVRGAIAPKTTRDHWYSGSRDTTAEERDKALRDMPIAERKKAIVAGETANTLENQDFAKSAREDQREIEKQRDREKIERADIGGYEKSLEAGKAREGVVNEEKKQADVFPLDKAASEQRKNQLDAKAAMAAAAQEIESQQREQQALQQQPGYQRAMQGGATGKGGGGGGLLGAITGKGGGIWALKARKALQVLRKGPAPYPR